MSQNTVLNAERGTVPTADNRRRIIAALATLLDPEEPRHAVVRCRAELRAAESRLAHLEAAEDPSYIWPQEPVA